MKRLFEYTTPLTMKLQIAAFAIVLASAFAASAAGSHLVLALGLSAYGLMSWPLIRDLAPVAWAVAIHGRWPARNI
ncbi:MULTISPECIES: hypothetical protein [Pseudomonas]|uniref:Uncharacterized protein n=1 Tax=Pseudomonas fluorescens TaxID=294 RepID=A0A161ZFS1_PSEFL|nr:MULTISPECIES: hypothetical protein [Pseudomonas]KZN20722.1 hypothetical protein A1D17_04045 [Pseudomonas fluorescens]